MSSNDWTLELDDMLTKVECQVTHSLKSIKNFTEHSEKSFYQSHRNDFLQRTIDRIREVYSLFENDNDIKKEIEDEIGDLVAVDNAHDMIEAELKVMLTNVEYEVTNSLRSIKLFIEQSGQPFHQSYQQHCLQSTIKRINGVYSKFEGDVIIKTEFDDEIVIEATHYGKLKEEVDDHGTSTEVTDPLSMNQLTTVHEKSSNGHEKNEIKSKKMRRLPTKMNNSKKRAQINAKHARAPQQKSAKTVTSRKVPSKATKRKAADGKNIHAIKKVGIPKGLTRQNRMTTEKKVNKKSSKRNVAEGEKKKTKAKQCDEKSGEKLNATSKSTNNSANEKAQCDQCQKVLSSAQCLKRHMLTHTSERPHECEKCHKRYKEKKDVTRHMKTHAKYQGPFKCEHCTKKFRYAVSFEKHKKIYHNNGRFSCKNCDLKFVKVTEKKKHEQKCTKRRYECYLCNRDEDRKPVITYIKHKLESHFKTHTGKKPFKCDICGRPFSCKGDIQRHMHLHTGEKRWPCNICMMRFAAKSNLNRHSKTHRDDLIPCSLCRRGFSKIEERDKHEKTCKVRLYECYICNRDEDKKPYVPFSRTALSMHFRTHTGEKPYACNQCPKRFALNGQLTQHKKTHTGDRPYECDQCNKRFAHKDNFHKHKRTHQADLFHCPACYNGFSKKDELEAHERNCKKRRYVCYICHRDQNKKLFVTKSKSGIMSHMIMHTGVKCHQCNYCKKRFNASAYLEIHKRIHTGEKPFSCNLCNKRFIGHGHLQSHMKSHTGIKPYECDQCNRRFSDKFNLQKHMIKHQKGLFHCPACFRPFAQKAELAAHENECKRRRYVCYICHNDKNKKQLSTKSKSFMLLHMLTHTGLKRYKCTYCKKRFGSNAYLEKHKRLHTGTGLYKCDQCPKKYISNSDRKRHIARYH